MLRSVLAYAGVLLATALGIGGMGLLFEAVAQGALVLAITGLPLLLFGLSIAGAALAASTAGQAHGMTRRAGRQ